MCPDTSTSKQALSRFKGLILCYSFARNNVSMGPGTCLLSLCKKKNSRQHVPKSTSFSSTQDKIFVSVAFNANELLLSAPLKAANLYTMATIRGSTGPVLARSLFIAIGSQNQETQTKTCALMRSAGCG